MKTKSHRPIEGSLRGRDGFTIIEVSLFLGISALLAVLLLSGWTAMLNTQRYRDSLRTVQSFVQQQYNLTYNVENERGTDLACDANANVAPNGAATNPSIGQSNCVIMGRYLTINNGTDIKVTSIVGREPAEGVITSTMTEYDIINQYVPKRVDAPIGLSEDSLYVPWGAYIADTAGDNTKRSHAIAIVRAPSGIVHTFVRKNISNPNAPPPVSSMALPSTEIDLHLCINPDSPLSGGRMGVLIPKNASSQSSILTMTEGDSVKC